MIVGVSIWITIVVLEIVRRRSKREQKDRADDKCAGTKKAQKRLLLVHVYPLGRNGALLKKQD